MTSSVFDPDQCRQLIARSLAAAGSRLPGGSGLYGDNLRAIADQLEAACAEVERLKSTAWAAVADDAVRARDRAESQRDALRTEAARIPDLQAAIGYEIEKRDTALAECDSLRTQLIKAKDEHTSDGIAWMETEHALTMERSSLRQQLDAELRIHEALQCSIDAFGEREERYLAARNRLGQQLEAAQEQERTLNRLLEDNARVYDATKRAHAADRDLLVATERELLSTRTALDTARRVQADLAAAQQRIDDLEAHNARLHAVAQDALNHVAHTSAALRVILPVYRAAAAWVPEQHDQFTPRGSELREAVDDAIAAITQEIADVIAKLGAP